MHAGSGNYVKMVHNGIEYGDMQLIAEAYDILHNVGGLTNEELAATFVEWNKVRRVHGCVQRVCEEAFAAACGGPTRTDCSLPARPCVVSTRAAGRAVASATGGG